MVLGPILIEFAVLKAIAGWLELVFGVIILKLIDKVFQNRGGDNILFTNPKVDFNVAIVSLVIFAGIIPSKRVVEIRPIDSIREE
ncbi:hypothetical protein BZG02_06855 [Labilibaculum filiforme]|uniref:Uncharacterized protein n=1 Tax=Labilibaculum filiforme TaxID=1940526 RepID=A0A2N3I0H5_9BACT|nr:hypothetical protein [Labilibaculum filiforme]PKQ63743.1 hypothetical protein BZG02_06855 [Labilibaculum filiforme]